MLHPAVALLGLKRVVPCTGREGAYCGSQELSVNALAQAARTNSAMSEQRIAQALRIMCFTQAPGGVIGLTDACSLHGAPSRFRLSYGRRSVCRSEMKSLIAIFHKAFHFSMSSYFVSIVSVH